MSKYSIAGFLSPSGNIGCLFSDSPLEARCDLLHSDWDVATPSSCQLVYGDSAMVGRHKARLTCHGDTVFGAPHQPTLAYGSSARYHGIVCTSRASGVSCANAAGHGFTIATAGYHLH